MSLFARPAYASTQAATSASDNNEDDDDNNNGSSIFSHSSRSYAAIIADEQRRKRERAEKLRLKQERKAVRRDEQEKRRAKTKHAVEAEAGKDEGESAEDGSVSGKKRRKRVEDGEEDFGGEHVKRYCAEGDEVVEVERSEKRRSPRRKKNVEAVTLEEDSPVEELVEVVEKSGVARRSEDDVHAVELSDEESDDELAELARQARAEKRLRDNAGKNPETLETHGVHLARDFNSRNNVEPEPTVKLLISSDIPNTKPLVVIRKLSQSLKAIREVWCQKQGFDDEFTKKVYLTHRMRKVFDVTTCKSLGLDVDAHGKLFMKGAEGVDGADHVHLEAVTEEIHAKLKAERERQKKSDHVEEEVEEAEESRAETQPADIIRLLIKAKGVTEPFKLKVKPTTDISKIIDASRMHFQVKKTTHLYLDFDGERLDPNVKVQDTEISDMDRIDAHFS